MIVILWYAGKLKKILHKCQAAILPLKSNLGKLAIEEMIEIVSTVTKAIL